MFALAAGWILTACVANSPDTIVPRGYVRIAYLLEPGNLELQKTVDTELAKGGIQCKLYPGSLADGVDVKLSDSKKARKILEAAISNYGLRLEFTK